MAYLNFSEVQSGAAASVAKPIAKSGFSALEWSVVAIAQKDQLSSLNKPGRMAVALSVIFGGFKGDPALADPQLEALRRVAVLAWHHGYAVPRNEIHAFHAAGYTAEQYETLMASISRGRSALNQGKRFR
jgi:alkylhydroperoxidase family enzyme